MVTLIHWKKGFIFHSLSLSWRAAVLGLWGLCLILGGFSLLFLYFWHLSLYFWTANLQDLVESGQFITFHLCPTEPCTNPCVQINNILYIHIIKTCSFYINTLNNARPLCFFLFGFFFPSSVDPASWAKVFWVARFLWALKIGKIVSVFKIGVGVFCFCGWLVGVEKILLRSNTFEI